MNRLIIACLLGVLLSSPVVANAQNKYNFSSPGAEAAEAIQERADQQKREYARQDAEFARHQAALAAQEAARVAQETLMTLQRIERDLLHPPTLAPVLPPVPASVSASTSIINCLVRADKVFGLLTLSVEALQNMRYICGARDTQSEWKDIR